MQLSGSSYSKDIIGRAIILQFTRISWEPKGYKYLSHAAVDCRNVWSIKTFAA